MCGEKADETTRSRPKREIRTKDTADRKEDTEEQRLAETRVSKTTLVRSSIKVV